VVGAFALIDGTAWGLASSSTSAATSTRSAGSGTAVSSLSGSCDATTMASTLPITAKPAVEPNPRCVLRMPDAMPLRSGRIDAMPTAVAGATERPAPLPRKSSPSSTTHNGPPTPTASSTVPTHTDAIPARVGRRPPKWAERRPAMGAITMDGSENASRSAPVRSAL
jgi:hypothetical protein